MADLESLLQELENKPLATSVDALKESRQALSKLNEPDSFSTEIIEEELLRMSPELYAFLFKQAKIDPSDSLEKDLQEAVARLGFSRVKKLIYYHTAYSNEISSQSTMKDRAFAAQLWSLNFRIAATAEHYAKKVMPDHSEELFYIGMLQNLGVSAFAQIMPSKHRALRESTRELSLSEKEKEHIGVTHYELGIEIVKRWNLPPIHVSSIIFEESHGQSMNGYAAPDWEDMFTLLYFAKYRAENKTTQNGSEKASLGIDPFFQYNKLLLQIAADNIKESNQSAAEEKEAVMSSSSA